MIQRRSKFIMLVAVLVVFIVAVPITFYEVAQAKEPLITVTDGSAFHACNANFQNTSRPPIWIPNVTSSASIGEIGYPNSSLSLNAWGVECNQAASFNILINLTGSLPSNLHPSGLLLTQNLSSPGFNCSAPIHFLYFPRTAVMTNTSYSKTSPADAGFSGDGSWNFEFAIENHANASSGSLFNFSVKSIFLYGSGWISGNLFFPHSGDTYFTTITAEILGLSRPVSVQIEFAFKDVI
jgi:hypothetical protein